MHQRRHPHPPADPIARAYTAALWAGGAHCRTAELRAQLGSMVNEQLRQRGYGRAQAWEAWSARCAGLPHHAGAADAWAASVVTACRLLIGPIERRNRGRT